MAEEAAAEAAAEGEAAEEVEVRRRSIPHRRHIQWQPMQLPKQ